MVKQKTFVEKNRLTASLAGFSRVAGFPNCLFSLPQFPVLSDPDHVAYKAFGVGKSMLGLTDARTTFVVDGKGVVRYSNL